MTATTEEFVDAAVRRLLDAGYVERDAGEDWPPGTRVLRRSDFRLRWLLTRLHTSIFLLPVDRVVGADVDRLAEDAARWARGTKGGLPHGFQTGSAALCVLVAETATQDALERASAPPAKRWAVLVMPIVVQPAEDRYALHRGHMAWGAVYQGFLAHQQRLVVGHPDAAVVGSSGSRVWRRALVAASLAWVAIVAAALVLLWP